MEVKKHGFTLIELLVVISIIALLSSIVLASLSQAREKAKIALAKQQLTQIRNAIELMDEDTGLGPNGCPLNVDSDIEANLDEPRAGLIAKPNPGDTFCISGNLCKTARNGGECKWTQADVDKWNGPYIKVGIDPWGHSYQFDPDYYYHPGVCDEFTAPGFGQAIYSEGPSAPVPKTDYPCSGTTDDFYLILGDLPPRPHH